MIKIKKPEDIYPAIDELISVFAQNNKQRLSDILHHRMYKVSWTSRDELLEELSNVLKKITKDDKKDLESLVIDQIEKIIQLIDKTVI